MGEETGDEIVLEPSVGRARPRWRDRRLLALLGAAATVAVLIQLLGSSKPAEISTAALDGEAPSTDVVERIPRTPPPTYLTTTTTTSPDSDDGAAPSTTLAPVTRVPTTEPPAPGLQPPPTVASTTTTTVNPHPWVPNRIGSFWQAPWWQEGVMSVGYDLDGVFNRLVVDFGDGETWEWTGNGTCNLLAGPPWEALHTYSADGEYTATLTVYGSQDCKTPPGDYRATSATTTVVSPFPMP